MLKDFSKDLVIGREGEEIVLNTLSNLTTDYEFKNVSEDCSCFYRGDIRAIDKKTGKELYVEVKNDSRIADTKRLLLEEEVYYKNSDYVGKGNMKNDTDILAVVSCSERKIYIFDFCSLKKIYKKYGEYKVIHHADQDTYCYLVDLCWCRSKGALIYKLKY